MTQNVIARQRKCWWGWDKRSVKATYSNLPMMIHHWDASEYRPSSEGKRRRMSNEEFSSRFLFFAQYTHSQTKNKRPRPSTPMGWRWLNNWCTSSRGSIFTLMERIFSNDIFLNSNNIPRKDFNWLVIGLLSPPISRRHVWKVMLMLT